MAISNITTDLAGAWITKNPDTVPQFNPGHRAAGDNGGLFLYGVAGAAIAAGDFVRFDNNYSATLLTTANSPRGAKVAVARYAMASGQWGWFQVEGQAPGRTAAAVAANAQLNTTATGGAVDDDAAVGSKRIDGIAILVAAAGATTNTEFVLSQPIVGATL
jgi:hypothetical protein